MTFAGERGSGVATARGRRGVRCVRVAARADGVLGRPARPGEREQGARGGALLGELHVGAVDRRRTRRHGRDAVGRRVRGSGAVEAHGRARRPTTVDEKDEDSATATLRFTWDVDDSDADWTYETHAQADPRRRRRLARRLVADAPGARPERGARCSPSSGRARPGPNVLGAGGAVIVEPRPVQPPRRRQDARDRRRRARTRRRGRSPAALGIDPDEYAAKVAAAGAEGVRRGDRACATATRATTSATLRAIAGRQRRPRTPSRSRRAARFARPILGTVGDATAEIVEKSDGAVARR